MNLIALLLALLTGCFAPTYPPELPPLIPPHPIHGGHHSGPNVPGPHCNGGATPC